MKRSTTMLLIVLLNIINLVVTLVLFYYGHSFLAVVCFLVLAFIMGAVNGNLCCKKCGLHPRTWLASHCPHCGEPLE